MSSSTTSFFKPLSMADSCLNFFPSLLTHKTAHPFLHFPSKTIKLRLYSSHSSVFSLKKKARFPSVVPFVAQTSDWAQQEDNTITIDKKFEEGSEQEEPSWENHEFDGSEGRVADWEAEGEDSTIDSSGEEIESDEGGGFEEKGDEEEGFVEPPEEAKLFVGNLPFDVDSEKLAMLFEKAGTVEIAEVIYNRETDRSRGFGFVTMSTVEEAEKAVETFNSYDLDGRLLTVNEAAPRGSRLERPPRVLEPAFRIYAGNLPWNVDNSRLEQVFSEHGKVVDARVVYDRETGRSRGFGFVTMSDETEMNDAITALDGQSVDGRAIRVNVAEERRPNF